MSDPKPNETNQQEEKKPKQTNMTAPPPKNQTEMVAGEKKVKVRLLQDMRLGQDTMGTPKGTVVEVSEEEAKNLLNPVIGPFDWTGERHGEQNKIPSKFVRAELVA